MKEVHAEKDSLESTVCFGCRNNHDGDPYDEVGCYMDRASSGLAVVSVVSGFASVGTAGTTAGIALAAGAASLSLDAQAALWNLADEVHQTTGEKRD